MGVHGLVLLPPALVVQEPHVDRGVGARVADALGLEGAREHLAGGGVLELVQQRPRGHTLEQRQLVRPRRHELPAALEDGQGGPPHGLRGALVGEEVPHVDEQQQVRLVHHVPVALEAVQPDGRLQGRLRVVRVREVHVFGEGAVPVVHGGRRQGVDGEGRGRLGELVGSVDGRVEPELRRVLEGLVEVHGEVVGEVRLAQRPLDPPPHLVVRHGARLLRAHEKAHRAPHAPRLLGQAPRVQLHLRGRG
mmetsp:Transcript_41373/g.132139  ORF Transcript_41373/g.132139 Transcript_41373/m.132139 type:complete len:249 (-) Transcript_41373:1951-2697(-)